MTALHRDTRAQDEGAQQALINEALVDHAERARRRGRTQRQWLASTRRSVLGRHVPQLLPHVAAVVWSDMFGDDDEDDDD